MTPTLKPFAAPVALERSTRREPDASFSTAAVTPAWPALIASRTCASVRGPGPIVMVTLAAPLLGVKLVPFQVPSWICTVPSPSTASTEA